MSSFAVVTEHSGERDHLFERRKANCEIAQALSSPYKQSMVNSKVNGKVKSVPLVQSVLEGEYYFKTPERHIPNSPYEARRIHFRGFLEKEEKVKKAKLSTGRRTQSVMHGKSVAATFEPRRKTSPANYLVENKKLIKILSRASSTLSNNAEANLNTSKRPQSAFAKSQNHSSSSNRKTQRPQSAFVGCKRRSITTVPTNIAHDLDIAPLRRGESPNTPTKIRYKLTPRHTEILMAVEQAKIRDTTNSPRLQALSLTNNYKLVSDYDYRKAGTRISGFEINSSTVVQGASKERKSPIQHRCKSTSSYYNFIDRFAQEAKPQTHQIKLAIHSGKV